MDTPFSGPVGVGFFNGEEAVGFLDWLIVDYAHEVEHGAFLSPWKTVSVVKNMNWTLTARTWWLDKRTSEHPHLRLRLYFDTENAAYYECSGRVAEPDDFGVVEVGKVFEDKELEIRGYSDLKSGKGRLIA